MKKYWLVLYQDTFLWGKNEEGLVYNASSDKHLCFRFANQGVIARITNVLEKELSYISTKLISYANQKEGEKLITLIAQRIEQLKSYIQNRFNTIHNYQA